MSCIVLLVEMRFGHDQISVVDPFDALAVVEFHGVFLDADGGLFQGAVHLRVEAHAVGLGAVVIDGQDFREIVFYSGFQLLVAFLQTFFSVPVNIVMAVDVMMDSARQGVLLGGATAKKQQT